MSVQTILAKDFVLCQLVSFLSLHDILRLSGISRLLRAQLDESVVWDYLIQTRFEKVAAIKLNPTATADGDKLHPKRVYLELVLSQKISTAGKDVSIAGLTVPDDPKQEDWWGLEEGGEFGRYASLRTICWGEWFAWRRLPAGEFALVVRMRWTTNDFDRVERPTLYQCRLQPGDIDPSTIRADPASGVDRFNRVKQLLEGGGEMLREFSVSDADRDALRATRGEWILLNLGVIRVPQVGIVTVRYWGCCPYWFGGWSIDWVGFLPPGLLPHGVSPARRLGPPASPGQGGGGAGGAAAAT